MGSKTSRSEFLKKLDKQLKDHSKRFPEWEQVHNLLFGLGSTKPKHTRAALDRTAAISAATFIEIGLRKAITSHLRNGADKDELKQLFEDAGAPLGSFYAKIVVAQSLGIIPPENRKDLDTIRNIRNAFAHSTTHIWFNDEPIKKLCFTLTIAKSFSRLDKRNSARMVYISATAETFFNLVDYCDSRER